MTNDLYINAMAMITPMGKTLEENLNGLINADKSGMVIRDDLVYNQELYFGEVNENFLPKVPPNLLNIACNRILLFCINQIQTELNELIDKYGKSRIAVIIGSSNTGIQEGQMVIEEYVNTGKYPDWFSYDVLELGSPAKFVADYLGLTGTAYTISTACSSSAKAFASARQLINAGVCDVAIVGGVDSLSSYASNGFFSLEALAQGYSIPFSKNRDGITIGEAGALFIVSKDKKSKIKIKGIGETSDAHHMTSPLPDGTLAQKAMEMALDEANIKASDINYVCLHGTGTKLNDSMESMATYNIFKDNVICSSIKPLIGHTLGACGSVELAFCYLLLDEKINIESMLPPHPWDESRDIELSPIKFISKAQKSTIRNIISNSFAFGGSNASIVIGVGDEE